MSRMKNIDKRNFLVCDCCYWCSSLLPDLENENDDYIDNCPVCNEKTRAMFISEDKSQRLDANYIQKIITKSDNWEFSNSPNYKSTNIKLVLLNLKQEFSTDMTFTVF